MRAALLLFLCACGGASTAVQAPDSRNHKDPHRHLTTEECGQLYDFMHGHDWLGAAEAPRDTVVKGCMDAPDATRAFLDCVLAASTREDAERCR